MISALQEISAWSMHQTIGFWFLTVMNMWKISMWRHCVSVWIAIRRSFGLAVFREWGICFRGLRKLWGFRWRYDTLGIHVGASLIFYIFNHFNFFLLSNFFLILRKKLQKRSKKPAVLSLIDFESSLSRSPIAYYPAQRTRSYRRFRPMSRNSCGRSW